MKTSSTEISRMCVIALTERSMFQPQTPLSTADARLSIGILHDTVAFTGITSKPQSEKLGLSVLPA